MFGLLSGFESSGRELLEWELLIRKGYTWLQTIYSVGEYNAEQNCEFTMFKYLLQQRVILGTGLKVGRENKYTWCAVEIVQGLQTSEIRISNLQGLAVTQSQIWQPAGHYSQGLQHRQGLAPRDRVKGPRMNLSHLSLRCQHLCS